MTEINLLPWREQKREQEKQAFIICILIGLTIALVISFVWNYYVSSLVSIQVERNDCLKNEIATFEKEIKEIIGIKKEREVLIAKMNIIQNLQVTRIFAVRLLDDMIKILPGGVYLSRMRREGDKITVLGFAESHSNISNLMRNIEGSSWIQAPELTEIKRTTDTKQADENEFKLSFILKSNTMLCSPIT